MKSTLFALAVALVAGCIVSAGAADIFVDNLSGDDRFRGSSADSGDQGVGPVRTIVKALRLAQKGDRIILNNTGEPYRECVSVQGGRNSGLPDSPFMIVGNGATLDGSVPVPTDEWRHVGNDVFRYLPPRTSYQMLFLAGRPAERIKNDGIRLPALEPLQWTLLDRHIYFRVEKGVAPFQYDLSCAGETVGISLYEVRNVQIRDITVQGYQLDGVSAADSAFDVMLLGVTCRGNARAGVSVAGASRVTIDDCLLGNNGAAQLRTADWSTTNVVRSFLLDNTAPPLLREGGKVTISEPPSPLP